MRFSEATGHKIVSTSTAATIGPVVWQQCSRYSPPNRVGTTLRRVAASRPCGRRTRHHRARRPRCGKARTGEPCTQARRRGDLRIQKTSGAPSVQGHAGQERSATPALVKIEIQSLNRLTSYARPFPQRCV